ncbi:pilus assembly protein [Duganella sp. LX20W]|uniref:Pilus assembly protein n=1 Tax=Rugamonas brunnea TaxID=2758569 RepID=A0A7W2IDZ2_9BURK|nr:TadE/TadG family type IV pilus assembly protein [Rugamonas brunnea]MBA5639929.1 pilus assembly protein [Rugamonas brunnea]
MRFPRKQQGAAAVELGFLLIPLVLLAFGVSEYGRAIYQYNTLVKATRDATRYLSAQGPGNATTISAAKCLAVYGDASCTSTTPLVPDLTTDMVSVCDSISCPSTNLNQATGSGVINLVTVTISGYPFTSLVPFVAPSITFNNISTTMRQIL